MNIWYRSSASRRPPAEKKESNSTQYTYLTVYTSLNIYPITLSLSFAICFKLQHPHLSLFLLVFISPTTLLIYNPGQSSPSLVIPLPCWFITASSAFFSISPNWYFVLISNPCQFFFILSHPSFLLFYKCLFCVFLSYWTNILGFP